MLYGEKLSMTFMVLMVASIPILPLLEVAVFGVTLSKISHLFNLSTLASIILVNGKGTSFWLDPWCDNGARLKDLFPRLYALDTCQDCNVCDRWCVNDGVWGGTWSWRFPPRGCALDDLEALVSLIGNLSLSDDDDKWSWSRDASGSFKVKTCCNIIQDNALADCRLGLHHSWNSLIPHKVNICIWRASINRLATHANLASRGIDIPSTLCLFYDLEIKSIEHCFISCSHVLPTWRKVWSWWQLDPPTSFPSFSIADIAMGHVGFGLMLGARHLPLSRIDGSLGLGVLLIGVVMLLSNRGFCLWFFGWGLVFMPWVLLLPRVALFPLYILVLALS
ncbi:RNA-directed DNA polymerase, eukaryota, reverse transcriptase zinc-binding domain protein [Tanacetum coccineum]